MKTIFFFLLTVLFFYACNTGDQRSASDITRAVADKIIRETSFELQEVPQQTVLNLQVLDYKNQYDFESSGPYYSLANVSVRSDTTVELGLDYSGAVMIFINGKPVHKGINHKKAAVREIAYSMFVWPHHLKADLSAGSNEILVKMVPLNDKPVVLLREIAKSAETLLSIAFEKNELQTGEAETFWSSVAGFAAVGPAEEILERNNPPEAEIRDSYQVSGKLLKWMPPRVNLLKEFVIDENNSYTRESYMEWHYASGTTWLGLLAAADALQDAIYSDFVSKVCSTSMAYRDVFKRQFEDFYAIRGSNNRMFRKSMLDDTGAPALPYLQTYMDTQDRMLEPLIDEMSAYVTRDQVRLHDGTFCRPEPVAMTVWADDLFMSVPFLVRMGRLSGDQGYFDDAARQVINFNKYLFDENSGLYRHSWFEATREKSKVSWGRANGWVIWGTSEALLHIPENHPSYSVIQDIFKTHIEELVKYQSSTGMWHQVLDMPQSFKETSCTAMFIIGIIRGVRNGWIDQKYLEKALLAWHDLKNNISADGTVKDICRGTGVGYDYEFYFSRKRFDNDPRGLGAVLTAAAEIIKLEREGQ